MCLTTGWPYLQAGSFQDQDKNIVTIILNEAEKEVKVEIDGVRFDVEAHSVKSIKFERVRDNNI